MKPDGSRLRALAWGDVQELRWSPNGAKLAFTRYWRNGRRLYVVNADGSALHRVSGPKDEEYDGSPAWSPNGRQLVFDATGDGWNSIYVAHVDGSGERRLIDGSYLTGSSGLYGGNAWSPDGRKIAFTDPDGRLSVMNPDGSRRRMLMRRAPGSGPSWSPDGRDLAVVSSLAIWVVHANGNGLRKLVSRGEVGLPVWSKGGLGLPVWSPDGRKLAFATSKDFVYVVNRDGRGLRKVGRMASAPSWSPDGRWLAFTSDRDGNGDIYIVKADGSGERQLTHSKLEEIDPVWSSVG
jgi:TolB protein